MEFFSLGLALDDFPRDTVGFFCVMIEFSSSRTCAVCVEDLFFFRSLFPGVSLGLERLTPKERPFDSSDLADDQLSIQVRIDFLSDP